MIDFVNKISWIEIGDGIDCDTHSMYLINQAVGTAHIHGTDDAGNKFSAVGYIDHGQILDIIESTLTKEVL